MNFPQLSAAIYLTPTAAEKILPRTTAEHTSAAVCVSKDFQQLSADVNSSTAVSGIYISAAVCG